MRYSNQLDDDFGDYILRKKEWDLARSEFEKTNKTGCLMKNINRSLQWLKQNPVPKNPVGAPTWEEMSDKERLSHMTSIIISVPITCAMFYALGQFLIDLLRSMP